MSRGLTAEASWLAQVGRVPVLPHERLMDLFRVLEDACARFPLPTPPTERRPTAEALRADPAAAAAWTTYDAAAAVVLSARRADPRIRRVTGDIAGANLRLVVSLARKRTRGNALRLMDLVSAGNEGLLIAIERFDWHRGFRFSTYATWWIKQAIGRWVTDHRRTIRMPAHASKVQRDMIEAAEAIERAGGDVPDRDALARLAGASETVARATLHTGRALVSLDDRNRRGSGGGENERSVADSVPDPGADPFKDVSELELLQVVAAVVAELSPREEAILRLRFGLVDDVADDAAYPITDAELTAVMDGHGLGSTGDGPTDAELAAETEGEEGDEE